MTRLHLSFLGSAEVRYGDQPLVFPTRKALALLVYLAVAGGMQSREKLTALFWPESDEKRGRGALRITLVYLRRALDAAADDASHTYLYVQPDAIGFNFDADFELDVQKVETAAAHLPDGSIAQLETTLNGYRGPFLDGFSLLDAPAFDEWVTFRRQEIHQQLTLLFDRLAQRHAESRQFGAGIAVAMRWIAHDPLDEAAHRRLMLLHALSGNKAAAWRAYDACRHLLESELGIEPSAETQALADRVTKLALSLPKGDRAIDIHSVTRATEVHPSSLPLIPFVGRAEEHAQLAVLFQEVLRGKTKVAVIAGEPGIGKTRLALEFLNWLVVQGVDVLQGRAFAAGGRLPYQPLVEALRVRIERENAPEDLLGDAWLSELSRLLPELRDRYPDLPPPAAGESIAGTRLLEAIARLGQALAGRALTGARQTTRPGAAVLFVDDIQWADAASLDVLHYCLRAWGEKRLPWLLLLTLRSEAVAADPLLAEWLVHLGRAIPVTQVNLGPVTAADTAQLVQTLAERSASAPPLQSVTFSFARWLYRETAGHPFFIGETLKALRERGLDVAAGSGELMAPPEGRLVVPGVRQLILSRLNRLSPAAQNLLTAVAILGRPCTFARICRVAGVTEDEALPALDELLGRQLLLEMAGSVRPYTISHDKIQEVVYGEAGDARRRLYHRRAFAALEADRAPPAELAHHAHAAHLAEPAIRYSIAAGDAAMSVFAIRDAIDHYERSRAMSAEQGALMSPGDSTAASGQSLQHLYTTLGRAYELMGAFQQAEAVCQEMLRVAREVRNPEMECAALDRLATLAIYTHQLETAASLLQQAVHVAESNSLRYWLARAEWGQAQLTHHQYDMQASRDHSRRALTLAHELDDPELIAGSLNNLAYAHMLLAELDTAVSLMTEARDHYQLLGNRALEADCLTAIGGMRIFQGRSRDGIPIVQQALDIAREIENSWGILFGSGWLAAGLLDCGQFEAALKICLDTAGLVQSLGTTPVSIWNRLWTGNAYRALLDFDAAVAAHREAAALNEPSPLPAFAWYIAAELCADYAQAGNWDNAYRQARTALTYSQYQAIPQIVLPRWSLTAALLHGGDDEAAREDVRRSDDLHGRLPRFRIAHLRSLAVLAEWEGDEAQATTYLEKALALAEEMGLQQPGRLGYASGNTEVAPGH